MYKKFLFYKFSYLFILLFIFLQLFLSSCGNITFNEPVNEFFEYYTNSAEIIEHNIFDSIGSGNDGLDTFLSDSDKTIYLQLRNPQQYILDFNYEFDNSQIAAKAAQFSDSVRFTQASDNQSAVLIFGKNFLNSVDNNEVISGTQIIKDLSGTITVHEASTQREFKSYKISVMVNTPPPRAAGAVFQRDQPASLTPGTTAQYIVCFNIKNLTGTFHEKDTKDLYIGSEHYRISYETGSLVISDPNNYGKLSLTPPDLYNLDGSAQIFTPLTSAGYTAVYYSSGVDPNSLEASSTIGYSLALYDDFGFSSSTYVSNRSDKLRPPSISVLSTGTDYCADDDTGIYNVVLSHNRSSYHYDENGETEGEPSSGMPVITYTFYNAADNSEVSSGSGTAPITIPLENGQYYVKAFASYNGYVDSDLMSECSTTASKFTIHKSANYYINKNASADGNGSKRKPYSKITQCIAAINAAENNDPVSTGYKIILQSDLSADNSESTTDAFAAIDSAIKVTVEGNGYTIDGTGYDRAFLIDSGAEVTFNNLNISGSGIDVNNSKLSYESGSISGIQSTGYAGSAIKVSGSSGILELGSEDGIVTITGNTAGFTQPSGAVYIDNDSTLNLYKAVINNNYDGDGNKANLYLKSSGSIPAKINICSPLTGSQIGIKSNLPPALGTTIQFTERYGYNGGYNNGVNPGTYFIGDEHGVGYDESNGEAILALSGGEINLDFDETVTFSLESAYIPFHERKLMNINVRKTLGTEEIDITSACTDFNYSLSYFGEDVGNLYYDNTSVTNSVQIYNNLRSGNYVLFVRCKYNGFTYSQELNVYVRTLDELYVSETGDDSNSGARQAEALRTFSRALGLIRESGTRNFVIIHISGNVELGDISAAGHLNTCTSELARLTVQGSTSNAKITASGSSVLEIGNNGPRSIVLDNICFERENDNSSTIKLIRQNCDLTLRGNSRISGKLEVSKGSVIAVDSTYTASQNVNILPASNDSTDRIIVSGSSDADLLAKFVCANNEWSIDREGRLAAPLKAAPDAVGDLVLKSGKAVAYNNRTKINSTQRADAIAVIFYDHNDVYSGVNQKMGDRLLGVGIGSFDGHVERYSIGEGTAAANGWFKWIDANNSAPCWSGGDFSRNGNGISGDVDGSDNLAQIGAQMRAWGKTDDTNQWHYNAIQWAMWSYHNRFEEEWRNGWYLPSAPEFLVFWWNRDVVNNVLDYAAPDLRKFNTTDWFWTSTTPLGDACADRDAIYFCWGDGKTNWEDSFRQHCVCAIRNFK